MKLMIASDIHGSAFWCEKLVSAYEKSGAERLLLLGDILYFGPRNLFPSCYDTKLVISMLNGIKDDILCVKGNCDSEVDQKVLNFPILSECAEVFADGLTLFMTHGHRFNKDNLPPLKKGDVLLYGHTHVPLDITLDGIRIINPGSVSLPREGSTHGYVLFDGGVFTRESLE